MNPSQQSINRRSNGSGTGIILVVLGLILLVGPFFMPSGVLEFNTGGRVVTVGLAVLLLIFGTIILVITSLLVRAPSDMAFVRTGMGGQKAIVDGSALVVPVVHEITWVPLSSMKFKVSRMGENALLTLDKIRAVIDAEFFVRIGKDQQSILTAATSLGRRATDQSFVEELLKDKLESSLRQVSAEMTLEQLLTNRKDFIERVSDHVKIDIQKNGMELETVTVSKLDQAPMNAFKNEENIFDAQGAATIAKVVAEKRVERETVMAQADQQVAQVTVTKNKFLYTQEIDRANAEADRDRQIKISLAIANTESAKATAEQNQIAQLAEVNRDRQVELARVQQAQVVAVASQQREQAEREAEIQKDTALQVAERNRQIEVANREAALADAKALQLNAQAESERANQAVLSVQVISEAERVRDQQVIQAEGQAKTEMVNKQVAVDIEAYRETQTAGATQKAASLRADARLTEAKANVEARTLEAQAEQALQMVPVQVEQARVGVSAAEVKVLQTKLEAQAQHQAISVELQVKLAQIEADKEVRIAQAAALGQALGKAQIQIYGDPSTLTSMNNAFFQGQQAGQLLSGLAAGTPDTIKIGVATLASGLAKFAQDKGIPLDPAMVETVIRQLEGSSATTKPPAPPASE